MTASAPADSKTSGGALIPIPSSTHAHATVRSSRVVRASTTISPRRLAASRRATQCAAAAGVCPRVAGTRRRLRAAGRRRICWGKWDLVVSDQPARVLDDCGRAAVVGLQSVALKPRAGLVERDDPRGTCAQPPVRRLVGVADDEQRVLAARRGSARAVPGRARCPGTRSNRTRSKRPCQRARSSRSDRSADREEDVVVEVATAFAVELTFVDPPQRRERLALRVARRASAPTPRRSAAALGSSLRSPRPRPAARSILGRRCPAQPRAWAQCRQAPPLRKRTRPRLPHQQPLLLEQPTADAVKRAGFNGRGVSGRETVAKSCAAVALNVTNRFACGETPRRTSSRTRSIRTLSCRFPRAR